MSEDGRLTLRLDGKVAIVVGAGSSGPGWGTGKAISVLFARQGAAVLGIDNKRDAWDIAYAAAFLASDQARYINGVLLPVDGGLSF